MNSEEFDYEDPNAIYRPAIADPKQDANNQQIMTDEINNYQASIPKDPHSMSWEDLMKHAAKSSGGGNKDTSSFQQAAAYRPALLAGFGVPQGGLGQMKGAAMSMI